MSPEMLILPMAAHVAWAMFLYAALTLVRAPTAWGVGSRADGTNPWADIEPRVSANLKNQFEWPLLFYVVCLLQLILQPDIPPIQVWLAWLFVAGRLLHSAVQILTTNIRLRGLVFTINFAAVLGMWISVLFMLWGP
jgi:hypothetical protein